MKRADKLIGPDLGTNRYVSAAKTRAILAAGARFRAERAGADDMLSVGDAAMLAARTSLQVHGAIGYTAEHTLRIWLGLAPALSAAWGTPAFHRARIHEYAKAMIEFSDQLSGEWRDGEIRDIDREMMRLTLNIVGRTLFSANVATDAAQIGAAPGRGAP